MNSLLLVHPVLTALLGLVLALFVGAAGTWSFLAGALVAWVNLILLVSTWPRILRKKTVALAIAIIVFKFAILGWILYVVVNSQAVHLLWFAAGLALTGASVPLSALVNSNQLNEKNEMNGNLNENSKVIEN